MKRIVTGILAHVDSGKTTLSEALLYKAGEIRNLGRVDHKDTFLDTEKLEKDRGITIFSKQAILNYDEKEITLLDTPGHVDFSSEMERTLQVLDYAILVISGKDGVQSHTETLWKLFRRYNIPVFIFVNKMDLTEGTEELRKEIMMKLRVDLGASCIDFTDIDNNPEIYEELATCDEILLEKYLATEENPIMADREIADAISARHVFPCYFGSALKMNGVEEFMKGFCRFITEKNIAASDFGARVYKIGRDSTGNRITYMKITGGSLSVKEVISGKTEEGKNWDEKVNEIRLYSGEKYRQIDVALPGMICAVPGLSYTFAGQGIGREKTQKDEMTEPVLMYRVELPEGANPLDVIKKLRIIEEEEPKLYVEWNELLQEIRVRLMGEIQKEILKSLVKERFDIDISFGKGNILYRETIKNKVEGVGHFEPLRHYAEVHLILEPLDTGSGMIFDSDCSSDKLDINWQRLILTHLAEKKHRGVLAGFPLTDIKITLVAGRAHKKHTEGGDFRQATYRAVRQGLMEAESLLLEPWYSFGIEVPSENIGRVMSDVQKMGGEFEPPESTGTVAGLNGSCPVSTMRDYQLELNNFTRGKGRMFCKLKGYYPCHNQQAIIEQTGYDCELDPENTADSVFCEHGSGFNVKWNRVKEHMHIDSVLDDMGEKTNQQDPNDRNLNITDKELMGDFDKLYGSRRNTKEKPSIAPKVVKAKKADNKPMVYKPENSPQGPEYLLIDGYNLMHAWEELSELSQVDFGAAREKLTDILCNYRGWHQCELILVFDAYKVPGGVGSVQQVGNINVVYTKEAETADMYIEKVTHRMAKKNRVRVVTSDGLEQLIITGHGAERISSNGFIEEIKNMEEEMRDYLD